MNPYNIIYCTNKMIDGGQCTVVWYVDDTKTSQIDPEVLTTSLIESTQEKYGQHVPLTMTCGKVHDYLGMIINLSRKVRVMISIIDYILKMFDLLPV